MVTILIFIPLFFVVVVEGGGGGGGEFKLASKVSNDKLLFADKVRRSHAFFIAHFTNSLSLSNFSYSCKTNCLTNNEAKLTNRTKQKKNYKIKLKIQSK